jgi:hypothetical protein
MLDKVLELFVHLKRIDERRLDKIFRRHRKKRKEDVGHTKME